MPSGTGGASISLGCWPPATRPFSMWTPVWSLSWHPAAGWTRTTAKSSRRRRRAGAADRLRPVARRSVGLLPRPGSAEGRPTRGHGRHPRTVARRTASQRRHRAERMRGPADAFSRHKAMDAPVDAFEHPGARRRESTRRRWDGSAQLTRTHAEASHGRSRRGVRRDVAVRARRTRTMSSSRWAAARVISGSRSSGAGSSGDVAVRVQRTRST